MAAPLAFQFQVAVPNPLVSSVNAEEAEAVELTTYRPGATLIAPSVGAVASTFRGPTLTLAELPARSKTVAEMNWLDPSPTGTAVGGALTSPDRLSEPVKLTLGEPVAMLYQPVAAGARSGAPLIVGAVLSMLMPETVALLLLPARSVT